MEWILISLIALRKTLNATEMTWAFLARVRKAAVLVGLEARAVLEGTVGSQEPEMLR